MLYIIRHGQTERNKKKVLQGRSNAPLNDEGFDQARAAGRYFAEHGILFSAIYTSPLIRAVQTAEVIAGMTAGQEAENEDSKRTADHAGRTLTPPIIREERLIEMDYGPYEGMELSCPPPEIIAFFSDFVHNPAPEGMEPLEEIVRRTGTLLEEIKEAAAAGHILLSTHAIAAKGCLEYLTPSSGGGYWSRYIGNCSVYACSVEDGQYALPCKVFTLPGPPRPGV